jgi:hypothetical protein
MTVQLNAIGRPPIAYLFGAGRVGTAASVGGSDANLVVCTEVCTGTRIRDIADTLDPSK